MSEELKKIEFQNSLIEKRGVDIPIMEAKPEEKVRSFCLSFFCSFLFFVLGNFSLPMISVVCATTSSLKMGSTLVSADIGCVLEVETRALCNGSREKSVTTRDFFQSNASLRIAENRM